MGSEAQQCGKYEYKHLALNLGIQPSYRKVDNFRLIQEEISRYWISKRILACSQIAGHLKLRCLLFHCFFCLRREENRTRPHFSNQGVNPQKPFVEFNVKQC